MNESTFPCNNRDQIEWVVRQVTFCLSNQSFETATGAPQGYEVIVQPLVRKRRTPTQNNCIHAYCEAVASDLNKAGYHREMTSDILKAPVELPWDKDSVKEHIWHEVQRSYTKVESSADLTTTQVQEIHQIIAKHLAETTGITTPWPDRFNAGGQDDRLSAY